MREIIYILISGSISLLTSMILAPLLPPIQDTFGHYLRNKITIYVEGTKHHGCWIIRQRMNIEVIKEPCNPFLAWYQQFLPFSIIKMKEHETIYKFQNEEIKKLWEESNGRSDVNF